MDFVIVGDIRNKETFAAGPGIRELPRLKRIYGPGRWRKRKGLATIRFSSGEEAEVELHWYEANGIGAKEYKIKHFLE